MNLGEVFAQAGIQAENFENVEVDTKSIENQQKIDFLEKWLKLMERNASDKEKYNFVTQHGYLSVQHLSLCLTLEDDIAQKEFELESGMGQKEKVEKEIQELKNHLELVETPSGYAMMMRLSNIPDINPYGIDVCRNKPAKDAMRSINLRKSWM